MIVYAPFDLSNEAQRALFTSLQSLHALQEQEQCNIEVKSVPNNTVWAGHKLGEPKAEKKECDTEAPKKDSGDTDPVTPVVDSPKDTNEIKERPPSVAEITETYMSVKDKNVILEEDLLRGIHDRLKGSGATKFSDLSDEGKIKMYEWLSELLTEPSK